MRKLKRKPTQIQIWRKSVTFERLRFLQGVFLTAALGGFGVFFNRILRGIDKGFLNNDYIVMTLSFSLGLTTSIVIWFYIIPTKERFK